jgi:hypothetical protein
MKPEIQRILHISSDQSVICILGDDHIPEKLKLSKQESDYALKQIKAHDEYIFINSYSRCIYLIRLLSTRSGRSLEEPPII